MLACQLAVSHLFYASLEEVFRGDLYQNDHVFLKLSPRLPLPGVLPIDLHMLVVLFGSASTDWEIKNLVLRVRVRVSALVLSTEGFGKNVTKKKHF